MKSRTLSVCIALTVLFYQLLSLSPAFYFTSHSYGDFSVSIKKLTVVQPHVGYKAISAGNASIEYESLIFVGDMMLGRNVEHIMKQEGMAYPFLGLDISSLNSNPAVIGNFESSMAIEHISTPAYAMKFSVVPEVLPEIKNAHFTHLSLANNHSFDFGEVGYKNTLEKFQDRSLIPFGNGTKIGNDSISIVNTVRGAVALIGINATQHTPSKEELKQILDQASRHSSFQIIYIHWGSEYELIHSPVQRALAELLVELGADVIIGHHPHVTQDIDIIKGVVVFYSLGNYIFDQYFSSDVQEGLIVGLDLASKPTLTLTPVTSKVKVSQPAYMKPRSHQYFLENLAKRSHSSLRAKIRAGSIPLLDTVATSTKIAIM